MYFDNEAPPPPSPSSTVGPGGASTAIPSNNFYHIYYESKRKNVSRLLTTLIAPSDSPLLLLGPNNTQAAVAANGTVTNTIRGSGSTNKNYVATTTDKRPSIVVFPTGECEFQRTPKWSQIINCFIAGRRRRGTRHVHPVNTELALKGEDISKCL